MAETWLDILPLRVPLIVSTAAKSAAVTRRSHHTYRSRPSLRFRWTATLARWSDTQLAKKAQTESQARPVLSTLFTKKMQKRMATMRPLRPTHQLLDPGPKTAHLNGPILTRTTNQLQKLKTKLSMIRVRRTRLKLSLNKKPSQGWLSSTRKCSKKVNKLKKTRAKISLPSQI